jgi:selenocysteine lyase/cysteine desulfurase
LLRSARGRLSELPGVEPIAADELVVQMASFARKTEPLLRVSIAAYNDAADVDALVGALRAAAAA